MSRWWRAYDDALHDPKVQLLDPPLFKLWFNILCVASRNNGILPDIQRLAFDLRVTAEQAQVTVTSLITEMLLDRRKDGLLEPHNWGQRQYLSDQSGARVERHRRKRVAAGLVAQWWAPKKLRNAVYERDNFKCFYCGKGDTKLSLDHRIPELRGGTHAMENLVTACLACNGAKRDLTQEEFLSRNNASNAVTASNGLKERTQTTDSEQITDSEQKQKTEAEKKDFDQLFEQFWNAYPRRIGKGSAKRVFIKALTKTSITVIVEAIERQKANWNDPQFIPHPATWLNGERWTDEIQPLQRVNGHGKARRQTLGELCDEIADDLRERGITDFSGAAVASGRR